MFVSLGACDGLQNPEVVVHEGRPIGGTLDQQAAQESDGIHLFEENVSPIIESTCASASCHSNQKIGNAVLTNSPSADRAAILSFLGGDCSDISALDEKLSGKSNHVGGVQNRFLSGVDAWISADPACQ